MNKTRNGNQPADETPRISGCPGTMGGTNGGAELLERIRALSFVKVELELYLDTHPECTIALEHYEKCIDELGMLMEKYQSAYGPLVAAGGDNSKGWAWTKQPWPWHYNGAADRDGGRGV